MFDFLCSKDTVKWPGWKGWRGFGENQASQLTKAEGKLLTTENINDQNSFVFWTFLYVNETT